MVFSIEVKFARTQKVLYESRIRNFFVSSHFMKVEGGQVFCRVCSWAIGSGVQFLQTFFNRTCLSNKCSVSAHSDEG